MRALRDEPDPDLTSALVAARIATTDLLLFVGVDPEEARAATRPQAPERQEVEISASASARHLRSCGSAAGWGPPGAGSGAGIAPAPVRGRRACCVEARR
jgi:hypothetical protein